jgi:fatty acid desaturase
MSGEWWRIQHNKHHSMPQKLGHDVDLNTLPLVAFTEKVCKHIGLPVKIWIRVQALTFPTITTLLVGLGWQFYRHPRHIIRRKLWNEGFWVITRYLLWTLFFTTRFGLAQSALMYLAYLWLTGNYLFLHFAVSHTHLPVVPKDDTKVRTTQPEVFVVGAILPIDYRCDNEKNLLNGGDILVSLLS